MRFLASCLLTCAAAHASDVVPEHASDVAPERANDIVLEEVIVTATLREQSLLETPLSISVLNEDDLQVAGQQHFEDVLGAVPNLHWAAGSSRPRFFQIRGIGEREEWQGAPNASVGFLIDDIDFSGMGMAATLFDVERVEVLRGPQGLRYGANALAGLIVVNGRNPDASPTFSAEASTGDYGVQSIGLIASAPAASLDSSWRLAVQRYRADGFRDNVYLHRDDVNDRDELTVRAKWQWQVSDATRIAFTWVHADLDNGYDAWSINNSRRALSDHPGEDSQDADGVSVRLEAQLHPAAQLTVIAAGANSASDYRFDGDWGNVDSWAPYTYDYVYRASRSHRTRSLEARLASPGANNPGEIAWLIGLYGLQLESRLHEVSVGEYIDPFFPEYSGATDDVLDSEFEAHTLAAFALVDGWFTERLGWSVGVRREERDGDYRDQGRASGELRGLRASQRDQMWGAQTTLHFDPQPDTRVFATLSRGYKAGGFNLGRGAQVRARFAPEYLWSLDLGARREWLDGRLYTDVTAFYMRRRDVQVATGLQLDLSDPNSYLFYTDNAAGGRNYGLESALRWQVSQMLELGAAVGVLQTRYEDYRPAGLDVGDREQAHAPEYQLSAHASWRHPAGWTTRIDWSAVDNYYFDVPPNEAQSDAYALTHVKLGYEAPSWSVYLWSRNVFDQDYATRGFFFGNEPPLFENKRYIQLGEPRVIGVSGRVTF